MKTPNPETLAARHGIDTDPQWGAVIPPLHFSSTFSFPRLGEKGTYDYTRSGNPTRDQLAECLSRLEHGAGSTITSSGMAACNVVLELLSPGSVLLAPDDCYGGCRRLFNARAKQSGIRLITGRFSDTGAIVALIKQHQPAMVWIETPSNPLLRISDIEAIAEAAHQAGALVVADNTFLSPVLQSPLKLGADIVVHSTTKYINGHSDVVGGAVICKDQVLAERVAWWANCTGLSGAPFDAFQTLRGLRTLALRMEQHNNNAQAVAAFLQNHSKVRRVYYPGLESHPQHAVAKRQQRGFGGVVSFELDGDWAAIARFVDSLKLFSLAESLGGVESLIAHPATMTHASMSPQEQAAAGINQSLLRLSVGIEQGGDLTDDLGQALETIPQLKTPGAKYHAA